jgi:hypothetical protein
VTCRVGQGLCGKTCTRALVSAYACIQCIWCGFVLLHVHAEQITGYFVTLGVGMCVFFFVCSCVCARMSVGACPCMCVFSTLCVGVGYSMRVKNHSHDTLRHSCWHGFIRVYMSANLCVRSCVYSVRGALCLCRKGTDHATLCDTRVGFLCVCVCTCQRANVCACVCVCALRLSYCMSV